MPETFIPHKPLIGIAKHQERDGQIGPHVVMFFFSLICSCWRILCLMAVLTTKEERVLPIKSEKPNRISMLRSRPVTNYIKI